MPTGLDTAADSCEPIKQLRESLAQSWLEREKDQLEQSFLAALTAVSDYCQQLHTQLDNQHSLEQQALANLTLVDKLRLKLGASLSAKHMSPAALQLEDARAQIAYLQQQIAFNSPGGDQLHPDQPSMLATAINNHERRLAAVQAAHNPARTTWVEVQLQRILARERKQQAQARQQGKFGSSLRKSSRCNVQMTVSIQGPGGTHSGITRDISGTGVFVHLQDADQALRVGDLITVQVSDLPSEALPVQGLVVRVDASGLGIKLLSGNLAFTPK